MNRQRELALAALLTEPTIAKAAEKANVSESTLLRWLNDSAFQAEYAQLRRRAVENAIGRLQGAAGVAVETLVTVARDEAAAFPANVRITAARSILEYSFKGAELLDFEKRLAELEAVAALQGERKP